MRQSVALAAVLLLLATGIAISSTSAAPIGDPAMERTWQRTDDPVASGMVSRTWMWGPSGFTDALREPYRVFTEEHPRQRLVQYFDKSRMEITFPEGDSSQVWHVTNGLLVIEMVEGAIQLGDSDFDDSRAPADVNLAGDPGQRPTYADISLLGLRTAHPSFVGETITSTFAQDGTIGWDSAYAGYGVTGAVTVDVSPLVNHTVASVFWEFMNSEGLVRDGESYATDRLFLNPYYATGYPITGAYWSSIVVGGTPRDVLWQCFERRCLTYTPGNPDGWKVEAGNVGQHYYQWRYGDIPGEPTATATHVPDPTVTPTAPPLPATIPVTGAIDPAYAAYDDAIVQFMQERGISAGTLTVMKDGQALVEHGYGWMDPQYTTTTPPDALMRIASVTKPMTAAVVKRLVAKGMLSLSSRVFCPTPQSSQCILWIEPPAGTTPDQRLYDIRVSHLIDHTGGWDRAISGDPVFMDFEIQSALDIPLPLTRHDIARYMVGQPLDFTPGTRLAYSNLGYLYLGLVIEDVTGMSFDAALRIHVLDPIGVADVFPGRTLPQDRDQREPWYSDYYLSASVFPPFGVVPQPDGGFNLEVMEAHGGLVASSRAVATFMEHYWPNGSARHANEIQNWYFFGSLPGTVSLARWYDNGVNVVVIFNHRTNRDGQVYDLEALRQMMDDVTTGIWANQ